MDTSESTAPIAPNISELLIDWKGLRQYVITAEASQAMMTYLKI